LFGVQGWHGGESILVPTGAALFATAGQFVDRGPGAGFGGFRADTFFLVTGFDVFGLTLLFVSVTGFIALRHGVPCLVWAIYLFAATGVGFFDGCMNFAGFFLNPAQ
jgi:hypothetical protein